MEQNKAILHFQPLELYPPVMNLLNCLNQPNNIYNYLVLSASPPLHLPAFHVNNPFFNIIRTSNIRTNNFIRRWVAYLHFNIYALLLLLIKKPDTVLYMETLSSWPAIIYKKIFPRINLMVHYHEYNAPEEIEKGMKQVKYFHKMEKKMYKHYQWISHTNTYRMEFFLKENTQINKSITHIVPNYPPRSWYLSRKQKDNPRSLIRLVYVGATGWTETTYFRELFEWMILQNNKYTLDIYTHYPDKNILNFINQHSNLNISVKKGVAYYDLPDILPAYDVGLILYNGHIPNCIYIAPNKLTEYIACGLNVILPAQMTGSIPYLNTDSKPIVLAVDFTKIPQINLEQKLFGIQSDWSNKVYCCDDVLTDMIRMLI